MLCCGDGVAHFIVHDSLVKEQIFWILILFYSIPYFYAEVNSNFVLMSTITAL